MRKLTVTDKNGCAACLACVVACSEGFYKQFNPDKSCIHILEGKAGVPKVQVCPQCGKCAKVCESGAITQTAKGVYMINKKLCTQCGKCAEVCPFGVIVKNDDAPPSKCTACGLCVRACPKQILEIKES